MARNHSRALLPVKGTLCKTTSTAGGTSGYGTLFKLAGTKETVLHSFGPTPDGRVPSGDLLYVGGKLYGTTTGGGSANEGAIFTDTI